MKEKLVQLLYQVRELLNSTRIADFLAPLLLRLYLVPVFWMAGMSKINHFDSTVQWFGSNEWGLGLPLPTVMAALATATELVGAVCLAIGLATRLMAIPLMITMLVAALAVHLKNGWFAIADSDSQAALNLRAALGQLQESDPELYALMVEHGKPVVLNNGIEFAATYFIMLLVLFFMGGGRWVSLDYWLRRRFYDVSEDA